MTDTTVLFAGDIGLDLTAVLPHMPGPDEKVVAAESVEECGGVVANAAVACLMGGASVRALVAIGDDLAGDHVRARLEARGVEVSATAIADSTTCRAHILLDQSGEKRLVLIPGHSMYPTVEQVNTASLADVVWLHTALYHVEPATALIHRCRALSIPWSVDLEPATFQEGLAQVAPCLDGASLVFVNERAAKLIATDPVVELMRLGVKNVVLTRGAGTVEWRSSSQTFYADPPLLPGDVRDTTGAGDALAGWLVARVVAGDAPQEALREAVTAATLSCRGLGAQPSFPSRPTVRDLLALSTTSNIGTEQETA